MIFVLGYVRQHTLVSYTLHCNISAPCCLKETEFHNASMDNEVDDLLLMVAANQIYTTLPLISHAMPIAAKGPSN